MRADIEQVRQQRLAKFCQVLLINKNGTLAESCNSIFDTDVLSKRAVSEWFPFLESVFPTVRTLSKESPELLFSKVEKPASFLSGYYDFTFSVAIVDGAEYFLWEIYDFTTLYEDFRLYQQKRNELEIQRQILALQNKNLRKKEDLHTRENLVFNKGIPNKQSLGSFDSALEAISNFVTNNRKGNDLIHSLENLSFQLREIISELPPEEKKDLSIAEKDNSNFSLENVLYDVLRFITSRKEINIIEASVAEDLPVSLIGNALDLKRVIVGLATNIGKLYSSLGLKIHLYLEDKTDIKCNVGIQVIAIDGEVLNPPVSETLLRIAIIKKIVELHDGTLEMESSSTFGSKIKCNIPFLLD